MMIYPKNVYSPLVVCFFSTGTIGIIILVVVPYSCFLPSTGTTATILGTFSAPILGLLVFEIWMEVGGV
jgi:hypothetical protein